MYIFYINYYIIYCSATNFIYFNNQNFCWGIKKFVKKNQLNTTDYDSLIPNGESIVGVYICIYKDKKYGKFYLIYILFENILILSFYFFIYFFLFLKYFKSIFVYFIVVTIIIIFLNKNKIIIK